MTTVYHLPDRPTWLCRVCGDPYPCETRRTQLLAEFSGASMQLSIFMALDLADATADLTYTPAAELRRRFLWFRYPPYPPPPPEERPAGPSQDADRSEEPGDGQE